VSATQNHESAIKQFFFRLGGEDYPSETSNRVAKFFKELEQKRKYEKFTRFNSSLDEMIIINGIKVFSFCEHHLLPFFGYCSIGYIPAGKILGLSKFQRLVDRIASRPTLQENITQDITTELETLIAPKGIGVAMTCVHTCMFGRGINTSTCSVNTQVVTGYLKSKSIARQEFLERIRFENIFR